MRTIRLNSLAVAAWIAGGLLFATAGGAAQTAPTEAPAAVQAPVADAAQGGTIKGAVKAGTIPLPGVSVTATNTLTGKKYATTSDVEGSFAMTIPKNGRYVVKVELAAFASATAEVLLNAAGQNGGKAEQRADFGMQLASRVAAQETQQANTTRAAASAIGRGLQSLSVAGDTTFADATAAAGNSGVQMPTLSGIGTGDGALSTDSVTVSGQIGQTNGLANFNEDEIRQRIQDAIGQAQRQGGAAGDMAGAVAGMLGGMMGGGGGFGGPGGGGGGRGGRAGGGGGGGFRGFNPTQPHGAIFYQGGNAALNATTYSLTGAPDIKPAYSSNRFGVSFTGSPSIPGVIKANSKQFIFLNVTGQRNINPQNFYGTVPTLSERGGDFSQLTQTGATTVVPLFDPTTGKQFQNNVIPTPRLSPQALALLNYYPAPNIPLAGTQGYNYQTITTAGSNATQAALRYVRNFGATPPQGGGRRGGGGGGRQAAANGPKALRQNINFNGSYSHTASDSPNIFLPLGGATESTGYGITAGYTIGYGRLTNNASLNWNRSNSMTRNYLTNGQVNPALNAGITVGNAAIQSNPFNYGVPSLTFSGFTSLAETSPSEAISQTISLSDFVSWSHKKHNMRYGIDVRRVHADSIGSANVLGSFTFSGYATQSPTAAAAAANSTTPQVSGSGFADFLLGLPQQSAIQAGLQKTYLRANVYDWYAQDDWRALPSLTLNFGLRYEYFSPYVEKNNHLVNLDHNADFTQVAAVEPDQKGPYSGAFPRSLVNPDRNMYSPRIGFAYRVKHLKETVLRGGYGINYNTGQYATFARQLAFQPPFAVTQTNIVNQQGCGVFTLANAFNCSTAPVQNNYAVNPNYRLGHVQIWNLDIQKTLPLGIVANVGYNGAKGGDLDIVRAPNRTATGLLNTAAQAFNYEDSLGYSRFESLSVNVRKRLQKGVSLQATYQYGHSIDDASSIGGGASVVAQNDLDLNAEEGNSTFDVRHKVTGNWVLELPFGPNRAYFTKGGFWSKALDGFSVSGDFTFATGTYYTPRYLATVAETNTGTNNTLRPDRNFAVPIAGAGRIQQWFNPAAFTAPPNGFGTASRGSIEGPGIVGIDASLSRTVSLGDTRSFEARVTGNNVFNTVQYSGINTTLNSNTFGQVTSTAAQRTISMIARYRF
ncbi:TonB-dependent receptor [Granulicella arctica]|uniref:TonB-dependent receptor n=1 Tax=Granulicella arctica TaxID=940613 RepID=UPI0021DFCD31|nr:TonB-dependent receptor [Granulicella arctica]